MPEVRLPHGPWTPVFSGNWGSFAVEAFENPDRLVLVTIKSADRTAFVLYKFFAAEGDASRLAEAFASSSLVFEKKTLNKKACFFAISSEPTLAQPGEEAECIENAFGLIEQQSMRVRELEKTRAVRLTDLKYAEEAAGALLSEPAILFGLLAAKAPEARPTARPSAAYVLGTKLDGTRAEEDEGTLARSFVIGEPADAEKALRVLVENAALAGLTCIIFDEKNAFARMDNPNRNFAYAEYPDLQPVGFPLKSLSPQDVGIDLNILSTATFREILSLPISGAEYCGREAAELLDAALEKMRGKLASPASLEEELFAQAEEVKKFHVYRAVRLLKVAVKKQPGLLDGTTNPEILKTKFVAGLGTVLRLDTQGLPDNIKAALILSVLKTLKTTLEKEAGLKAVIFLPDAEKLVPLSPFTKTQEEVTDALLQCSAVGVSFCAAARHEIDLSMTVGERVTARLEFVSEKEVAVKTETSRPYRIQLRPPLSAE